MEQFAPETYIVQPTSDAWVERREDGALILRWRPETAVVVYAGTDPEAIDRAVPPAVFPASEKSGAALPPLDPARRFYFEVHFQNGAAGSPPLVVAERVLPLSGGINFRDIGGYPTRDGRMTRWGRFYRAGSLADLTDDDVAYLERLGLRLICDLRTGEEVAAHPDRLPPAAVHQHRPVTGRVSRLRRAVTLFRKRRRLQEVLEEAYTHVMIAQNPDVVGAIFRQAADPANLPMVAHCTAGKDRTGVITALLLVMLGVPDEIVVADYTLSNAYYDVFAGKLRRDMQQLFSIGFNEEQLRPFLLAEARTMEGALAYVRGRYGSAREYVHRMAGVPDSTLDQLRANLLT